MGKDDENEMIHIDSMMKRSLELGCSGLLGMGKQSVARCRGLVGGGGNGIDGAFVWRDQVYWLAMNIVNIEHN